jgi:hypothetical protein
VFAAGTKPGEHDLDLAVVDADRYIGMQRKGCLRNPARASSAALSIASWITCSGLSVRV